MATLESNRFHATVGYLMNGEYQYYGANLDGEIYRKYGTENIFGTAQDNIYPQIASAESLLLGTRQDWGGGFLSKCAFRQVCMGR